ncbi:HupE/UreJ family protein [Jiella marina]|uniref:HupE/UreJ family protein n=1 Tax=Jiella sp. LLJ827 TaxID=2917712 RepID=UPI002100EBC6|nr:HupE/UreJ family protein [Jiella sp. LLJ827]MCQ0986612.1 HupE/UreJ family protein [Jiella sp. LLJ827]
MPKRSLIAAATLLASAAPAFAHLDPAAHGSTLAGATHPLTGLDHLLVMVMVGVWAATFRGTTRFVIPAAFVVTMLAGFGLAMAAVALPFVEPAILASVVAVGLLLATAVRVPAGAAVGLVGAFALFHGYAHGSELGAAGALAFAGGFAVATALLHGLGLWLATFAMRHAHPLALRIVGVATALAGAALYAAA